MKMIWSRSQENELKDIPGDYGEEDPDERSGRSLNNSNKQETKREKKTSKWLVLAEVT